VEKLPHSCDFSQRLIAVNFFAPFRMRQAGPKAEAVFQNDVNDTYARMEKRCAEIKLEQAASGGDREQIQLVAEDPSVEISFNLPDGPPPEQLVLEGEGVEDLDINEVKVFLQRKWDIFESLPEALKEAMKTKSLEEVNKVLGKMDLAEAEHAVELMQEGGMLSFR
jgi:cell division cycle protein 37